MNQTVIGAKLKVGEIPGGPATAEADRDLARRMIAEGKIVLQQTKTGEYVATDNTLIINLSTLGLHVITPRAVEFVPGLPHGSLAGSGLRVR